MNAHRLKAYLLMTVVAIIWGVAGPVIKYTLEGFDSLTFLTYRFGISTILALLIILVLKDRLPKDRSLLLKLLEHGFITSTVSLGFLFFGLENTTVLDMSLITLINPLLVTVAGVFFLNEHVTKREKIGMSIALIGTLLTVIGPIFQNGGNTFRLSGNILIVGYLLAAAWGSVLSKELLRKGISPLFMTNVSFIIGFLTLLPFFLLSTQNPLAAITNVPVNFHLGVVFMALLSGSLAYYLFNKAQKTIEIGEAAVFSYLYPLFSTPLAVFWLGEKISTLFIVGGVIVAIGVILSEVKTESA